MRHRKISDLVLELMLFLIISFPIIKTTPVDWLRKFLTLSSCALPQSPNTVQSLEPNNPNSLFGFLTLLERFAFRNIFLTSLQMEAI